MEVAKKFKKALQYSLLDETKAAKDYAKMIAMVPNEEIKAILTEIRNDELDHHKKLLNIKSILGF